MDCGLTILVSYQIQAHYLSGNSAWSDTVWLEPGSPDMTFVPGPQGSVYIAARNLPAGTTALRLTRVDQYAENYYGELLANAVSFDIPVSTGTNGLYLIPAAWTTSPVDAYGYADYLWFVQSIDANGNGTSQATPWESGYYSRLTGEIDWLVPPYFDGRVQLKQNLIFLLRAATVDPPFTLKNTTKTTSLITPSPIQPPMRIQDLIIPSLALTVLLRMVSMCFPHFKTTMFT